ncbi:hypothetical protein HF650_00190 [Kosakonia sp. SMBL-WEM22]|uniref:hypothetical protein n=1 Tax=Kosakonia sp. SMBL-WEM22 TaxID=2725560 RepID=UPI001659C38A|nr:hypothetical protein [Kosakonia sp. SMBL-WEM22]MDV5354518.1 hypothetical protein [Enterobacter asburiae]QNQ18327.1 hypothetical protein HF650_00190 [Kosakonia sp. SMBL-WEM22]
MRYSTICESGIKILFAFIIITVAMPADSHIQKPASAAIVQLSTDSSIALPFAGRNTAARPFLRIAGEKQKNIDHDGLRHRDYFRNLTECPLSCDLCASCCTCFIGSGVRLSRLTSYSVPLKPEKRSYSGDIEWFSPCCHTVRMAACY